MLVFGSRFRPPFMVLLFCGMSLHVLYKIFEYQKLSLITLPGNLQRNQKMREELPINSSIINASYECELLPSTWCRDGCLNPSIPAMANAGAGRLVLRWRSCLINPMLRAGFRCRLHDAAIILRIHASLPPSSLYNVRISHKFRQ